MIQSIFKIIKKYSVDLVIFGLLLYLLMTTISEQIYCYVSVWYAMNYSYGFGSRLLVGTILQFLFGDYITTKVVYRLLVICFLVIIALFSYLCGSIYRQLERDEARLGFIFLIGVYLASPAAPGYLWTPENMGRLETFLLLLTLIIILLAGRIKNYYYKTITLSVLACIALTIHQVYFFLYFPALLVIFIQDFWKVYGEKKKVFCMMACLCTIGTVFLYMQFFSGIYIHNVDELFDTIKRHTDLGVIKPPLEAEYFWTIRDHFVRNQLPELRARVRFGIITIVLLMPFWGCFALLWKKVLSQANKMVSYSESKDSLFTNKNKYRLMLATNVAYIPVFVLMTDWGRWFAALFTVMVLDIVILVQEKENFLIEAISGMGNYIKKYPCVFAVILIYLAGFEKFQGINNLKQVENFYYHLYGLIH